MKASHFAQYGLCISIGAGIFVAWSAILSQVPLFTT